MTKNLYLHIPFCARCCAYCDFNRVEYQTDLVDDYLDALSIEFTARGDGLRPETIYLGGGTPTCLSLNQLEYLLSQFDFIDSGAVKEFTVEANPGTLDIDKLILLRDAGVTRISLGVQSFNQRGLDFLGRMHNAKTARFALALLHEVGFANISVDLIFAWAGQTLNDWRDDLEKTLALNVQHISCYGLTYPENTPLKKLLDDGKITPANEDHELALFNLTNEILAAANFARYEISNFSAPQFQSLHNLNYWRGGTYLGLGAGAHSYQNGVRSNNYLSVREYIDKLNQCGNAQSAIDELSPERRARECAVVWLRLREGIDQQQFATQTGFSLPILFTAELPMLIKDGWLEWHGDFLRLSDQAIPVADAVLAELV